MIKLNEIEIPGFVIHSEEYIKSERDRMREFERKAQYWEDAHAKLEVQLKESFKKDIEELCDALNELIRRAEQLWIYADMPSEDKSVELGIINAKKLIKKYGTKPLW